MRVAILPRHPGLYSTRGLEQAFDMRGHEAKVLNTLSFSIGVERGAPRQLGGEVRRILEELRP